MKEKRYKILARVLQAYKNCIESGNTEWEDRHERTIHDIMQSAPSGSGIDSGTSIDYDRSNGNKLVFNTSFHHMNDAGFYDGWTEHIVTVYPHLCFGIDIRISGRNRNDIKDYLLDVFHYWLMEETD